MSGVLAVLQARVSSRRLPGKVLLPLLGRPMLLRQIERLRRCRGFDQLVVATSTDASDEPLAALCAAEGLTCHRGPLDDVLARFHGAAERYRPEHVLRLTGDCPLADPGVIDRVVSLHVDSGADYSSNCLPPTFPDGLDAEVLRYAVLEQAHAEAVLPSHREHVTLFVHSQPHRFRCSNLSQEPDHSALRWTVDEPADFALVEQVYRALYPLNPAFSSDQVLELLQLRPELARINDGLVRNEGLAKSLASDPVPENL